MSRLAEGAKTVGTGVLMVLGVVIALGLAVLDIYVLFRYGFFAFLLLGVAESVILPLLVWVIVGVLMAGRSIAWLGWRRGGGRDFWE